MSTACCNQEDWVTRPQNGVSIAISKLTACRFGNFIKDASKVGGNLAAFVFLVAAFGLPLPAGGVACQPQTPPTPQNQSGMEKQRTFHTPIGDAPSPKLHATRAAHQQSVLRRTAHISNLLNDICLERWAQWIRLLYTCICLDIFAPMAPKHQFLISLAWRGPRAPLWFFIICFSNLHLPVLCFGYSTRHFPVHGLPIWILNDYWFFPAFFHSYFRFPSFFSLYWLSSAYRWPILWHSKQTVSQAIGLPAGIQIEIRIQGQTNLLITRSAQSSRAVCRVQTNKSKGGRGQKYHSWGNKQWPHQCGLPAKAGRKYSAVSH